jgi:hypothetical protein
MATSNLLNQPRFIQWSRPATRTGWVTRIVCIAGLAALAACSERASTTVAGDLFRAELPGEWSQVSARPDLYVFRRTDGNARVTISISLSKESMPPDKQRETLQKLAENHRTVQSSEGAQVMLTPMETSDSPVSAHFTGNDAENNRRTATLLLGAPSGIVIVHLELLGADEPTLEAQSKKLFAGVTLVQPQ